MNLRFPCAPPERARCPGGDSAPGRISGGSFLPGLLLAVWLALIAACLLHERHRARAGDERQPNRQDHPYGRGPVWLLTIEITLPWRALLWKGYTQQPAVIPDHSLMLEFATSWDCSSKLTSSFSGTPSTR
jgi:hypothetical protein